MSEGTATPFKCVICGGNIGQRKTCVPIAGIGVAHPSCAYPLNANMNSATSAAERRGRIAGLREAAEIAYLSCLHSGRERRTARLGLRREPYEVEYAAEAKAAILAHIAELEKT